MAISFQAATAGYNKVIVVDKRDLKKSLLIVEFLQDP
jgi:hypothetical protein